MINKWTIYLINLLENLKSFAGVLIVIAIVFILFGRLLVEDCLMEEKLYFKILKSSLVILLASAVMVVVIPCKQTMYLMAISDYVTQENIEAGTESIRETFDYLIDGINRVVNGDEHNG